MTDKTRALETLNKLRAVGTAKALRKAFGMKLVFISSVLLGMGVGFLVGYVLLPISWFSHVVAVAFSLAGSGIGVWRVWSLRRRASPSV